jgi:hypothetical protein
VVPVGPGQALPIPIGVIRAPLDKKSVKALLDEFTKAYETLEDEIDLTVPNSPSIVLPGQS